MEPHPLEAYDGTDGRPRYYPATPGVGGAISDLVKALAVAFAPRSVLHRPIKIEDETNKAAGLGDQF